MAMRFRAARISQAELLDRKKCYVAARKEAEVGNSFRNIRRSQPSSDVLRRQLWIGLRKFICSSSGNLSVCADIIKAQKETCT
jgi:hypothetical protein